MTPDLHLTYHFPETEGGDMCVAAVIGIAGMAPVPIAVMPWAGPEAPWTVRVGHPIGGYLNQLYDTFANAVLGAHRDVPLIARQLLEHHGLAVPACLRPAKVSHVRVDVSAYVVRTDTGQEVTLEELARNVRRVVAEMRSGGLIS